MNIRVLAMLVSLWAAMISPARAGEEICFQRGEQQARCGRAVLQHVAFKSVILQFVDPGHTTLGESLSRLLWREVLESISDLGGAGVILASDDQGEIERQLGKGNLAEYLERGYHDAATEITEEQHAQMAVWGAVLESGPEVFVQTFLTLDQAANDAWTTLTFAASGPSRVQLSTRLGRERLNLAPLRGTRADLFARDVVTRCPQENGCPGGIPLRAASSNDAAIVSSLRVGDSVRVDDMQGRWFRVPREGAPPAWLNIYFVEMFPREVAFSHRTNVKLRAAPGGEELAAVDLDGRYAVSGAARRGSAKEPWYRIDVNGRRGWVAGKVVDRRSYTFPAVHLIAGFYRYGRQQYKEAIPEFMAFLEESPADDNVTRAVALQFLAASHVAGRMGRAAPEAVLYLDRASQLTPFDPDLYSLRALVRTGTPGQMDGAMSDLRHALQLDPYNPAARRLLADLTKADREQLRIIAPEQNPEQLKSSIETMRAGVE